MFSFTRILQFRLHQNATHTLHQSIAPVVPLKCDFQNNCM